MTPGQLVAHFRENQNNNKTLKSLFASQFLGKFSAEELEGMTKSISKELARREAAVVQDRIDYLTSLGYNVSKQLSNTKPTSSRVPLWHPFFMDFLWEFRSKESKPFQRSQNSRLCVLRLRRFLPLKKGRMWCSSAR